VTNLEQQQGTADRAKAGAADVVETAREETKHVVDEAGAQARSIVSDLRSLLSSEARSQTKRISSSVRQWSDELGTMAEGESPTKDAVRRVARSGRRAADYLESKDVEDVLDDVRDFARRRPGTFLAAAAIAGLAVGRLAKSSSNSSGQHRREAPQPSHPPEPPYPPQPAPLSPQPGQPVTDPMSREPGTGWTE
jgi:hypothetical protein